jgi:hypothetical protein
MSVGARAHVANGVVERADGLSFGGSYHLDATGTAPERIVVSLWDGQAEERDFELSVGEALEFCGQTWQLDEISDEGRTWSATLTRIA